MDGAVVAVSVAAVCAAWDPPESDWTSLVDGATVVVSAAEVCMAWDPLESDWTPLLDEVMVVVSIAGVCVTWDPPESDWTPLLEEVLVVDAPLVEVCELSRASMILRRLPSRPNPKETPLPPDPASGAGDTESVSLVVIAAGALSDAGEALVVTALVSTAELSLTVPSAAAPRNSGEKAGERATAAATTERQSVIASHGACDACWPGGQRAD